MPAFDSCIKYLLDAPSDEVLDDSGLIHLCYAPHRKSQWSSTYAFLSAFNLMGMHHQQVTCVQKLQSVSTRHVMSLPSADSFPLKPSFSLSMNAMVADNVRWKKFVDVEGRWACTIVMGCWTCWFFCSCSWIAAIDEALRLVGSLPHSNIFPLRGETEQKIRTMCRHRKREAKTRKFC